jgi:hypothetical protein
MADSHEGARQTLGEMSVVTALHSVARIAAGLKLVDHTGVKGVLREGLVDALISGLLPSPYKAGTGIITDYTGRQSGQCDIVVWDDSIMRPLFITRGTGIFAIESVVAVIEVKSILQRDSIEQAIAVSRELKDFAILREPLPDGTQVWKDEPGVLPINLLFGFTTDLSKDILGVHAEGVAAAQGIELWQFLQGIVVLGRTSSIFLPDRRVDFPAEEQRPFSEFLMVLATLLNSIREVSKKRGYPRPGNYLGPRPA